MSKLIRMARETLVPDIQVSRISGISPLFVFFDASGTVCPGTDNPWHECNYQWYFGETSGVGMTSWGQGTRTGVTESRNYATGPIAGHVFENPGPGDKVVTVQLLVLHGSQIAYKTVQITIQPADEATAFATTKTVVWDPSGAFTGITAPAGAQTYSLGTWAGLVAAKLGSLTSYRIQMAAGQVYDFGDNGTTIKVAGPVQFEIANGSTGAKPKLRFGAGATANSGAILLNLSSPGTATIGDYRFIDTILDGSSVSNPSNNKTLLGFNADGGINYVTQLRCEYNDLKIGNNHSVNVLNIYNSLGPPNDGHVVWNNWCVQDCAITNPPVGTNGSTSTYPYGYFGSHEKSCFMGNNFDLLSPNPGTHVMRLEYSGKVVVTDNLLANPGGDSGAGSGRVAIKAHGPLQFTCTADATTDQITRTSWEDDWGTNGIDRRCVFATDGVMPAPLVAGTPYWIKTKIDANNFTIAATRGGAAINITDAGTGQLHIIQNVTSWLGIGAGQSKYIYTAHTDFNFTPNTVSPYQVAYEAQDPFSNERVSDVIHECNWHRSGTAGQLTVISSANNFTYRNNLVYMSGTTTHGGVTIRQEGLGVRAQSSGVYVYNNSFYSADTDNDFIAVTVEASDTTPLIKNNLAYTPSGTGSAINSGTATTATNTGDVGGFTTDPKFSGALTTPLGWKITDASSYTKNAGTTVPVWRNFFGTMQVAGSFDIGAGTE